jgi:hypothetical protein
MKVVFGHKSQAIVPTYGSWRETGYFLTYNYLFQISNLLVFIIKPLFYDNQCFIALIEIFLKKSKNGTESEALTQDD